MDELTQVAAELTTRPSNTKDLSLLRIVIDYQQDATILLYLCIPNQLYMFWAMYSPIIRSTRLYFTASI